MKPLTILLASLLLIVAASGADKPPVPKGVRNADVEALDKLRAGKDVVVLDVRTPKEFAAGHIPGAVNIDWNAADFAAKAAKLDTNKTYLVHCAGGVRSAKACGKLHEMRFPRLVNLEPGFREWEKAGKPVEKAR